MIQTVKRNEQLRKEYHILPAVLTDAFDEGEARDSSQAKLETARNLHVMGLSSKKIAQATGQAEVEALK